MLGFLGRKVSVFSSVRSVHVGGFAAGSFLGNSGDECNPVAAELHSEKGLPLWSGTHARIAGVSSLLPPPPNSNRTAPHRTAPPCPAVDRPSSRERSGSRLLLSPFVGRALLVGRPQILLVDVIDTPCLLP